MSKYTIEDTTLTAIADKLRETSGETEPITPEEMPEKVDEVFASGAKSEYDRFWDSYQNRGKRTFYDAAFAGAGWDNDTFQPKYNITPTSAASLFSSCEIKGDLVELLDQHNVVLDTSKARNVGRMFDGADNITRVGTIAVKSASLANSLFPHASALVSIDKLVLLDDGSQGFQANFTNCTALKNMAIAGTIGQNGFDIHWSTLLTHDSLMSIIRALQDKSSDTSGTVWTVTLGEANLSKLTEEEIGIAEAKGWVLA